MKLKLFAVTMAAATAFLAACNKETNYGQQGQVPEGIPTYASISVVVSNPGSKVATRAASQEGEKEITNVDILIFDKSGVLETVAQAVSVTSGSGYETGVIQTTTGQKTVYVIANNSSKVTPLTPGLSLSAFEQMTYEAVNVGAADAYDITVPIATASNFLMFGSTPATLAEKQQSDPNVVSLSVKRAAAKSQLLFSNVQTSENFQPENVAVDFTDASTQLAQMQTQMYVALGDRESAGEVTKWYDVYNDDAKWIAARVNGFDQNNSSEMKTVVEYSHYTAENVHATPLMNNTTCMLVRVKATPTKWTSDAGTQAPEGTFYAIVKYSTDVTLDQNYQTLESYYGIYKDKATADAVLASGDLSADPDKAKYAVLEYTNGYSYYRLNLRDINKATSKERYSVLRNNFYKVTVTEINNIGWNNPGDLVEPDDERPVETETSLKVTITVEDWTDVNMNEPLG